MQSIWEQSVEGKQTATQSLNGHIKTDVLIIGGGMAGMLCAYRLKQAGVQAVVVEAKSIGGGVTKNTTAKITAQHGLIYAGLIKKRGLGAAAQYYAVNEKAVQEFRTLSQDIPCDFENKMAYVYSLSDHQKLHEEALSYQNLHIPHSFLDAPPLPFSTVGALGMENQAQFNPMRLLLGLKEQLPVYENSFVTNIEENTAYTRHGRITAKHIILATHFPMINIPGLYFLKLYQHRSYVLALQNGPDMNGMFVDEREDGHSFRNYGDRLLFGGGDHRTGKKGGGFDELRELAKSAYPGASETNAWATQDCMTLDGLPYIGSHSRRRANIYVAAGFNKWGMTGGMVAAIVLTELIKEGKSAYAELFSPQRSVMHPQLFINAGEAALGLIGFGRRCPHMGCALKWNAAEHTWDCPCHGSRFDKAGQLIDNPAKRGIHIE